MPPKSKSKNAPNQHDKRHESGLAPPGKRVTKKHSNGQLNGQPNGKPVSSPTSPQLPSPGVDQGFKHQRTADSAYSAADSIKDYATAAADTERDRTYSDASLEEGGQCGAMADDYTEPATTSTNADAHAAACKRNGHTNGGSTSSTVSTLLAYYPLRDAISILILLLSLPPTLVLVIQTLFASLTFVPPTITISLSTLSNIKDMFNSSNFGYPALATILSVDLIFWVCWLPVWKPLQNVFLDLSQAVIAVSLSGAATSSGGPTYSIATCTAIVCIVHVLRYRAIHLTALDYLRSVLHNADMGIDLDLPSFATNFSPSSVDRGWLYTVIRTILGIHIVSQGVTTCIRRSLVKANEQSANVPAITRSDTEATAGVEPNPRSSTGAVEGVQHTSALSTDGRPPGPSPAPRDKVRESASKKKRKHANQLRSQQPLWAAIASTKVTFVKEMEQRDAVDDAREAARMDTNTSTNTTNTNYITNRIWVCEVRDTEIFFSVELSAIAALESADDVEEGTTKSAGIDKSKPFFVRINGATWSSTRIGLSTKEDGSANSQGDRYDGEIFGLAPLSSYKCELVGIASQTVLCSASIITQPAPVTEQAASTSSQPTHQALRPSSPITTLKQSIQQAEAKLNETRNRTKKTKKDQRSVHSDIKREINVLKSKLESSGGNDEKQERRLVQIGQHKTQAEEASTDLKRQIDALGEIPEEELAASESMRKNWRLASDAKSAANKDLESARAEAEREVNAIKSEISQTESKREKLATRHVQRTQELEKLTSRQQADMSAKQQRDLEKAQINQKREEEANQFKFHITAYETELQKLQQKAHDAYQEIAHLQSWGTQPPPYPGLSSPPTPEGAHAVANGSLGSPQANGFPTFGPHPYQTPFHSAQPSMSNTQVGPRGRSSSMLSQYSGFTDNGEEYSFSADQPRAQHSWPMQSYTGGGAAFSDDRKASEGSGSLASGSTGSNSPHPDAKTFVPGKTGHIAPIGPPGKTREKSSSSPTQPSAGLGAVGSGR